MKHMLKAMLIAGALGTGAFLTAPAANAQYYQRPGVSVYIGVGSRSGYYRDRDYYRHRYYHRTYYDRGDYWRWRHRCNRWRHDCGNHYGWRNHWRRYRRD
jgi:hypothetical protein